MSGCCGGGSGTHTRRSRACWELSLRTHGRTDRQTDRHTGSQAFQVCVPGLRAQCQSHSGPRPPGIPQAAGPTATLWEWGRGQAGSWAVAMETTAWEPRPARLSVTEAPWLRPPGIPQAAGPTATLWEWGRGQAGSWAVAMETTAWEPRPACLSVAEAPGPAPCQLRDSAGQACARVAGCGSVVLLCGPWAPRPGPGGRGGHTGSLCLCGQARPCRELTALPRAGRELQSSPCLSSERERERLSEAGGWRRVSSRGEARPRAGLGQRAGDRVKEPTAPRSRRSRRAAKRPRTGRLQRAAEPSSRAVNV